MCCGCLVRSPQRLAKRWKTFRPQWRAAAQWKSRGAETLVALQAQSPSGLKKAAQALRQAFSADLYGAGADHSACRRGGGAGTAR